jgi:hypothetical protein
MRRRGIGRTDWQGSRETCAIQSSSGGTRPGLCSRIAADTGGDTANLPKGGRYMKKRSIPIFLFVAFLVMPLSTQVIVDEEEESDPERLRILEELKGFLKDADTYEAIEFLNRQGDPVEMLKRYSDLVNYFYWGKKRLLHAVAFARAGMQYSLTKSWSFLEKDPAKANELRKTARVISHNLASYTWPGWDEEGIVITETDIAVGLDAAKLNLRLVRELEERLMPLAIA